MSSFSTSALVMYDEPTVPPSESEHWKELPHQPGDKMVHSLEDLLTEFKCAFLNEAEQGCKPDATQGKIEPTAVAGKVDTHKNTTTTATGANGRTLAYWSCILGYCEALSTHKDPFRRFQFYPIPMGAICRLVDTEFISKLPPRQQQEQQQQAKEDEHRSAARSVANWVWNSVVSKSNIKDEQHANSLYTCLRGSLDNKSVDCFGAALCTVMGLQCLGFDSMLTLSEDHAYESHHQLHEGTDNDDNNKKKDASIDLSSQNTNTSISGQQQPSSSPVRATCEVAIPGSTNAVRSKRGQEIRLTFKEKSSLTPQTSWLYMAAHPVVCGTTQMTIAAALANINCTILEKASSSSGRSSSSSSPSLLLSGNLFDMKRELLWLLKDYGHLSKFPFGLLELGDCEENRTSHRGDQWMRVDELGVDVPVLTIEALYLEAIAISRTLYKDAQVYPYCYAGHYHKDAGQNGEDQEYRLVECLRLYAEASRVASGYVYEWGDSLQLTKVMVKLSEFIVCQVLGAANGNNNKSDGKVKQKNVNNSPFVLRDNAIAAGTWLLSFYDSLFLWEERTGSPFLPVLASNHKHSVAKAVAHFPLDIRQEVIAKVSQAADGSGDISVHQLSRPVTSSSLQYCTKLRSRRMRTEGPLLAALGRQKVSVGDMELSIVVETTTDGRSSKRSRRSR